MDFRVHVRQLRAVDAGINYIIDGHSARVALNWQHQAPSIGASSDALQLGVQIQR